MGEVTVSETELSKLVEIIHWALNQDYVKICKSYLKSAQYFESFWKKGVLERGKNLCKV